MLKRVLSIGVVLVGFMGLLVAHCGGEDTPTTPSGACPSTVTKLTLAVPAANATVKVGQVVKVTWCYPANSIPGFKVFLVDTGENKILLNTGGQISAPANTYDWTVLAKHVGTIAMVRVANYIDDAEYAENPITVVP